MRICKLLKLFKLTLPNIFLSLANIRNKNLIMFWLALLFYVGHSRPLASQCTAIPAGSNMTNANGDNVVFVEPIVTGKCEIHTNEDHNGVHTDSHQFICSNGTAALLTYGHDISNCSGTTQSTPITLNGSCTSMGCLGFNHLEFNTTDCTAPPQQNFTNEYVYWTPDQCLYNATQTCVNGQPQTSFWNNTACSGTPQAVVIAGQCIRHGHQRSVSYNATDNPCGTNVTNRLLFW
eukprot:195018_1